MSRVVPAQSLPHSLESHLPYQALGKLNYEMWKPSVAGCERLLLLFYPVPVEQSSFCKYFDKLWTLINVFLLCNTVWIWLYFRFCHRDWLGFPFKSQVVMSCRITYLYLHWGKVRLFNLKLPERTAKLVLFFSKGTRNQKSGVPW